MWLDVSSVLSSRLSGVSPGIRQARGAASRANHLQLQSGPAGLLKLRPSAPVSSRSDRPETASRPARPQKTWFYSSTVWTRTAGGGGEGGRGLHLENWGGGTLPYKLCAARTQKNTSIYFHSVFKFPSYVFFLLLPPFHFEQGQCFVYSSDGKPLLVFAWSL